MLSIDFVLPSEIVADVTARPGIPDALTVFEMFESLGLKMETQKGVVQVYMVDRVERPAEN